MEGAAIPRRERRASGHETFGEAYLWLNVLWLLAAVVQTRSEASGAVIGWLAIVLPLSAVAGRAASNCAQRKWLPAVGLSATAVLSAASIAGMGQLGWWTLGLPLGLVVTITMASRVRWSGGAVLAVVFGALAAGLPVLVMVTVVTSWIAVGLRLYTAFCARSPLAASTLCPVYATVATLVLATLLIGGPIAISQHLRTFPSPESYWLPLSVATAALAAATVVAYALADLGGEPR